MLVFYFFTLNHWVTLTSLPVVAKALGWDWHPTFLPWRPTLITPLVVIFTYPFRWLPENLQTTGLNLFSAVCAALTLALLARSVTLLPHDRTREQRSREPGAFGLLTINAWWLPPLLAVLVCGLELSFWEHATAFTGEVFDLLIFAYLIRSLLEYRISQKESWLMKFTFVYGLGVTNNWALLGFFPFFLGAFIWIKGIGFFNRRFLLRAAGFGLIGLSFYLVLPLIGMADKFGSDGFWSLLHYHLAQQKMLVKSVPRWLALVLSLSTLVPVIIAGINWPSFHGELSPAGKFLSDVMFRIVHFVFLASGLVLFFDGKYSPRGLAPNFSLLSFYFLGALSVGYFSGYTLLVYGKDPGKDWQRPAGALRAMNFLLVAILWITAVAAPIGLLYQNFSRIQADNSPAIYHFGVSTARNLPAKGAIVLSDDINRLLLTQAAIRRSGQRSENIFIDTSTFAFGSYHRYLYETHPELQKILLDPAKSPKMFSQPELIQFLEKLSRQYKIFYLHPSFGYYFERFYARPHGLVYELKPYAGTDWSAAPLTPAEISENENFWNSLKPEITALPELAKKSSDIMVLNYQYSRSLNYWGTELQKARRLNEAGMRFAEALKFNPENVIAQINAQFNTSLRQGTVRPVQTDDEMERKLGQYRSWDTALNYNGPFDEPNFNLRLGQLLAQGNNLRQAAQHFQRVLELRPADPEAQLALAKTYVDLGHPDLALRAVHDLREQSTKSTVAPATHTRPSGVETSSQLDRAALAPALDLTRVEALAYLAQTNYPTAEKLLRDMQQQNPKDENCVAALAEFYRFTGYMASRNGQTNEAKQRFANALAAYDKQTQLAPDNPEPLFRKSELLMQSGSYDQAIFFLSRLLQDHPNDAAALLNRAIAQLKVRKYDAAKRDYLLLQKLLSPNFYVIYFGLSEIALEQHDNAAAIKNMRLYLKYAPPDRQEYTLVRTRLAKIEAGGK